MRAEQRFSQHSEVASDWVAHSSGLVLVPPDESVDPHGGVDPNGVFQ